MKIFKHKNIMGVIYSLLILVPIFSVLVTSCYVIFNKNAYESYYGETINQSEDIQTSKLKMNYEYTFINSSLPTINTNRIGVEYIELLSAQYTFDETTWANVKFMNIAMNTAQTGIYLRGYDENNVNITQYQLYSITNSESYYLAFRFKSNTQNEWTNNTIYETTYNKYSYLDNAFDYALYKVTNDTSFGKIDFLSWFQGLFLENTPSNNRYVGYANWYMNYVLFVSSSYILFLVLMWFVNYSRRLLERGMNYDW